MHKTMKKIIASLAAVALACGALLCVRLCCGNERHGRGQYRNVAQGKTYTTTTAAYGDDENAFYLDEAGIKVYPDCIIGDKVPWSADAYVKLAKAAEGTDAFSSVVIDLEQTYTLSRFAVNYYAGENGGVYYPLDVKVYISDDKTTWTLFRRHADRTG